ncbi:unnamed protein product [Spirodela intermedia]|uniref:Uncharacterized protein n=1 Tax=Spirodela intermedia TaxID=51605 RepID=A0A7I8IAY1_SPIIN|nr:unnamed protein product [Spirodela intermedia]CAA6654886.1 unnamed protein product [Spirodela intermedia]
MQERTNVVADALSRQRAIVETTTLLASIGDLLDEIRVAYNTNPTVKQLIQQIESGETRRF